MCPGHADIGEPWVGGPVFQGDRLTCIHTKLNVLYPAHQGPHDYGGALVSCYLFFACSLSFARSLQIAVLCGLFHFKSDRKYHIDQYILPVGLQHFVDWNATVLLVRLQLLPPPLVLAFPTKAGLTGFSLRSHLSLLLGRILGEREIPRRRLLTTQYLVNETPPSGGPVLCIALREIYPIYTYPGETFEARGGQCPVHLIMPGFDATR